jgi:membrane protein YdbS with pleckstrin-like domain
LENLVWKGRPSQLTNLLVYLFLFWTIVIPLYRYLKTRFTIFELTSDRFRTKIGILSQKVDELELYRVRDYEVFKPFLLRLFGLGNLTLITSDKTHPKIEMKAIKNPEVVLELFRKNVEISRRKTGTKEVDFT